MIRILVVDDEYDLLQAVKGLLEDEGFQVIAKSNGREALAYLETDTADLVLLDVMMPHLTGFEVAEIIRQNRRFDSTPVVIMSAAAAPTTPAPSGQWQAFLRKPFSAEALLEIVRGHVTKTADK